MDYRTLCVCFLLVTIGFAHEGEGYCSKKESDNNCIPLTPDRIMMKRLVSGLNSFAFNMHKKFAYFTNEDAYFSPLSLATVFSMLYYGSAGQTAKELGNMLGFATTNLTDDEVHTAFNQLLKEIHSKPSTYQLSNANALLVDKTAKLFREYKLLAHQLYNGSVKEVDFRKKSPKILREVNRWVDRKTHGNIRHIIGSFMPNAELVVLSAAHFKAKWKTAFQINNTHNEIFNNGGHFNLAKEIPMMHKTADFHYYDESSFQVLELPFEDDNISMIVILPRHADKLPSLEKGITLEKLMYIRKNMYENRVFVTMPRFKLRYSKELSGVIHSLGVKKIFKNPDFSSMMHNSVTVSENLHKVVLEISENGMETGRKIRDLDFDLNQHKTRYVTRFKMIHPFMLVIMDNRNDMILFMGRIFNL